MLLSRNMVIIQRIRKSLYIPVMICRENAIIRPNIAIPIRLTSPTFPPASTPLPCTTWNVVCGNPTWRWRSTSRIITSCRFKKSLIQQMSMIGSRAASILPICLHSTSKTRQRTIASLNMTLPLVRMWNRLS